MAHIVILGAGLGGLPLAYEMKHKLKPVDRITVISNSPTFHFVPSNPWIAVNWRKRGDIEIDLPPLLARHGIALNSAGARRVHPERNQVELGDGSLVDYDILVVATGPKLAFDEIDGLGPKAHTQ
jgi:sulfide:quinone oxidoreductase